MLRGNLDDERLGGDGREENCDVVEKQSRRCHDERKGWDYSCGQENEFVDDIVVLLFCSMFFLAHLSRCAVGFECEYCFVQITNYNCGMAVR